MIGVVATITVRLAACTLVAWLVWRSFGAAAMVPTLPLFGIALARPLLDLASALRHAMHRSHWRDVEGRHYAYRGRTMRVVEDDAHGRWVRLADVRAIVGFTASDGALAITYPEGVSRLGRPPEPHVRDDALLAHLDKERSPEALRLRQWVEREIAFPARRERARLGIRPAAPEPGDDD
ncbi:MAG TPA: hypothetical protein VGH48_05075 [Caldimonas sp.]